MVKKNKPFSVIKPSSVSKRSGMWRETVLSSDPSQMVISIRWPLSLTVFLIRLNRLVLAVFSPQEKMYGAQSQPQSFSASSMGVKMTQVVMVILSSSPSKAKSRIHCKSPIPKLSHCER